MKASVQMAQQVPVTQACSALNVPRSRFYRAGSDAPPVESTRPSPAWRLSETERRTIRNTLNSEAYVDMPPRAVVAALLDQGIYLCSWRTMYRILSEYDEVRERRNVRRHPNHTKPQLVARDPRQVWSWDITRLKGASKGLFYYLYVIMDLYSRYVVGWMVAERESEALARTLISETFYKEGLVQGQITLHSDRGAPMTADAMVEMLDVLGINRSLSRPRVSNDNPYSEAQFKTLKYRPEMPKHFDDLEHANAYCRSVIQWYQFHHFHSGIAFLPPAAVHAGHAEAILSKRQDVLDDFFNLHPERFPLGPPSVKTLPSEVWINDPALHRSCEVSTGAAPPVAPAHSTKPSAQGGSMEAEGQAKTAIDVAERSATNDLSNHEGPDREP